MAIGLASKQLFWIKAMQKDIDFKNQRFKAKIRYDEAYETLP